MKVELEPLPPQDAIAFFRQKGFAPPDARFDFRDVWREEHARSFVVAKAMRDDVLQTIRGELDRSLAEGRTLAQFTEALEPELKRQGWWGESTERDPLTGELRDVRLGSRRRLRVIFQSNMRAAHAAGQWARIQRAKGAFPFLRYVQIQRDTKREAHERYHGLILPVDHPAWARIFPPNGWFCGCTVQQLNQRMLDRRGWTVREGFELEELPTFNRRKGIVERIAAGVDPAWDGSPGHAWAGMERRPGPAGAPPSDGFGEIDDPDGFVAREAPAGLALPNALDAADPQDREAARFYKGIGYRELNRALRGQVPLTPERARRRDALDRAIERAAEVPAGTMLYRGIQQVRLPDVGDLLSDRAFSSFSISPRVAVRFADFGNPEIAEDQLSLPTLRFENLILRLRAPGGLRGLWLGRDEDEVVLARDGRFRIVAAREIVFRDPDTGEMRRMRIHDMEIVDGEP